MSPEGAVESKGHKLAGHHVGAPPARIDKPARFPNHPIEPIAAKCFQAFDRLQGNSRQARTIFEGNQPIRCDSPRRMSLSAPSTSILQKAGRPYRSIVVIGTLISSSHLTLRNAGRRLTPSMNRLQTVLTVG